MSLEPCSESRWILSLTTSLNLVAPGCYARGRHAGTIQTTIRRANQPKQLSQLLLFELLRLADPVCATQATPNRRLLAGQMTKLLDYVMRSIQFLEICHIF